MVFLVTISQFLVNIQNKRGKSVFLRVSIILLWKKGNYTEMSTRNLGDLGRKGDTFQNVDFQQMELSLIHTCFKAAK